MPLGFLKLLVTALVSAFTYTYDLYRNDSYEQFSDLTHVRILAMVKTNWQG